MSVLVGKEAPDFTASAVMPDNQINDSFNLKSYLNGKVGILFFYPLDFTFVCPSEIISFNNKLSEFKSRNVEVIAVSVDSKFSHLAWKNTPVNNGGIGQVQFPIVSDLTKQISRNYDVLIEGAGVALRGTFLIDKKGVVRNQVVNDLPLGRSIDEALRIVDALNFHEENGEVCPAGWNRGSEGMKASPEGVAKYLDKNASSL
ncbi:MAG: peroxiredoxin [Rickettsiales bacterium]|nr:peroxiredoxin [Pseudomonadota bacterium]MDA0965891.1 peroxiredoxin [Pseudomonadota bacterium]MDG4542639.1 peroxiredoxin [Rickettsiales bacterium]MDG4545143.1 peroxiredoxin [Rickettsiales bacterium]MDG4547266.1 peroxiredoxin [Rickettsiales bacterium]